MVLNNLTVFVCIVVEVVCVAVVGISTTTTAAAAAGGGAEIIHPARVFDPIGLQHYTLRFPATATATGRKSSISFHLSQAETSTCAVPRRTITTTNSTTTTPPPEEEEQDETARVLWGASVALTQYLLHGLFPIPEEERPPPPHQPQHPFYQKTVLELGAGSQALPSLVCACCVGGPPHRVIATDAIAATLEQIRYHVGLNSRPQQPPPPTTTFLETYPLDWTKTSQLDTLLHEQELAHTVDIILAADVLYGTDLVPALVTVIDRLVSYDRDSRVILATREGRDGIAEFRDRMTNTTIAAVFDELRVDTLDAAFLPPLPDELQRTEDARMIRNRYYGNFTIYTYQRKRGR